MTWKDNCGDGILGSGKEHGRIGRKKLRCLVKHGPQGGGICLGKY